MQTQKLCSNGLNSEKQHKCNCQTPVIAQEAHELADDDIHQAWQCPAMHVCQCKSLLECTLMQTALDHLTIIYTAASSHTCWHYSHEPDAYAIQLCSCNIKCTVSCTSRHGHCLARR